MKKNRSVLIITAVLIAVGAFLIYQNKSGTIRKEDRDFTVSDTASVTKIFLADRSGGSVTLERQPDGTWIVNKKYLVRKGAVDLLLECFKRISVQTRVARAAYNTVIRELSTTGVKCEIYVKHDDKPLKVYYVGGSTQDVMGTYMMLENSTVPFVTEIPGFQGYLTPRFSTTEKSWRATTLIEMTPDEIKSVSVVYNFQPEKSFTFEQNNHQFMVSSPVTHRQINDPDTMRIKNYLSNFRHLNFEAWDRNFSDQQTDSLRRAEPATVLSVTGIDGKKFILPIYPKPVTASSLDQNDSLGNPLKFDLDRMYAFISDGKELVTIQYYIFSKVFATIDDFDLSKRNIKKPHN